MTKNDEMHKFPSQKVINEEEKQQQYEKKIQQQPNRTIAIV